MTDRANRYLFPPDLVVSAGRRLEGDTFAALAEQLHGDELLFAFGQPKGSYLVAGHIQSAERFTDFSSVSWLVRFYALSRREIRRNRGTFDQPLPEP